MMVMKTIRGERGEHWRTTILFTLTILYLTLGLYVVKEYAAKEAAQRALTVNNATTCAFRQLVDTPIAGYRRTIKIQQAIVADNTRSAKVRETAQKNVEATTKTLDGLVNFRAVYHTVPPGFKCPAPPLGKNKKDK